MIECLSNPSWINPQIDCLLFLQNLRITHFEMFDKFFLSVTILGEFWLPTLICAITYWCIDFRAGVYLFTLEGLNVLLTHFFKMLACVYRPWILNNSLQPSNLAVPYAKGYSFPSGHSAMSGSVLGGVAYLFKKKPIVSVLLILLILTVGFSRLWLGVHTPQDVICGFLIAICLIFAVNFLINWAENNKNRYLSLTFIIDFLAILALIYIDYFNNYRIDFVNGELLVNPQKSIYTTFVVYGYALGLLNGCFLCRRFFPFEPNTYSLKKRIIIGVLGTLMLLVLLKFVLLQIVMNTISFRIALPIMFFLGVFVTLIYPLIFNKLDMMRM